MFVQSPNAHVHLEPKALFPLEKQGPRGKGKPASSRFSLSRLFGRRVDPSYGVLEEAILEGGQGLKSPPKKLGKKANPLKNQNDEQKGEGPLPADRRVSRLGHAALDSNPLSPQDKYEVVRKQLVELDQRKARSYLRSGDQELRNVVMEQLRATAKLGYIPAMETLGNALKKEPNGLAEAVEWYKRICAQSPEGRIYYKLGEIYEKGGQEIQADPRQAMQYYRMAIENRYLSYPIYRLALLLEKTGIKGDAEEAFRLLKCVAPSYGQAGVALARFYEEGIGVEKNMREAVQLYKELAPSFGNCAYRLGELYMSGAEENGKTIISPNPEKALYCYRLASNLHHPGAQRVLEILSV